MTGAPVRPWPFDPWEDRPLNRRLDALASTRHPLGGVEVPTYLAAGAVGVAAGLAAVTSLGLARGLPVAMLGALSVAMLAAFVVVGVLRRVVTGRESHVLLEGVLVALAAAGAAAWGAGMSVAAALDVMVVGLGVFLVAGRVGCFLSGCCHGRPCALGVRYGRGTVHETLVGIRLFPLQLAEAAVIALLTGVAALMVIGGAAAGSAVWGWLVGYAVTRLVLDPARGDARSRRGPLTEAQWLALGVVVARVAVEVRGVGTPALTAAQAAVVAGAAGVVAFGVVTRGWWLALPPPPLPVGAVSGWQAMLDDLEAAARAAGPGAAERRRTDPSGTVGVGLLVDDAGPGLELHSYALRGMRAPLDDADLFPFAGFIAQRLPAHRILRAGPCAHGAFHYWALVEAGGVAGSTAADVPAMVAQRARAFAVMVANAAVLDSDPVGRVEPRPPAGAPPPPPPAPLPATAYFSRSGMT